ncbi:DegT/DnrJ/EryC1/StrS family aminotransferase [Sphingomonas sp. C3-2]|uniref:DegT/DnrJ/EryC1/StrS family aminotransferase n=1 Tax=Sphingomonas sp. C3-2 TaxID=3062169 RepID=UPI00294AB8F2|nr:DegT/DnrJ/EryC1/StrS family aminotransferase [Sphingomonas sp. C3-2]WOK36510.1 DegT/DnrJ/EryC1/StrS family aminotransferase [Sphingomonas sp. C3-2]
MAASTFSEPLPRLNRTTARTRRRQTGHHIEPIRSRWPVYAQDEIDAVAAVLHSGRVNALHHGDNCHRFESEFAQMCAVPHAIAVANGTLALELALRAVGIAPGDEVIVPARSFMASASCIVAVGAVPVFADVDPDTQNLNAETVAQAMSPKTRAVIAVHLAGHPCAMDELTVLTEAYDIKIIEDCAQAHGARFNGRPVGSFGHAAAFSFCTDKIMSTGGEGGMLLLREEEDWARAWAYKDHGKNPRTMPQASGGGRFLWLHDSFGSNFRMTEMQAAIGLQQLRKLPDWLETRRRHAAMLNEILAGQRALRLIVPADDCEPAYYKYYAFVRPERLAPGWSRDAILEAAIAAGLPCQSGSCPEIYREQACIRAGYRPESVLRSARQLGEESIMMPIDHTLDDDSIRTMGEVLRSVLDAASAKGN